jgi:hypothetical protein
MLKSEKSISWRIKHGSSSSRNKSYGSESTICVIPMILNVNRHFTICVNIIHSYVKCMWYNLTYILYLVVMVASRMRAQLSPSPVDHNKNTIWFTQWSRFIENKYVNIYASSRKICPYLFIFISNSQKIYIRCLLKILNCDKTDVGRSCHYWNKSS